MLTDRHGGKVKITDFAPRFRQFGRVFRPPQIFRIVEPIAGLPRITIRMRPTYDYGKPISNRSLGSNHIRYAADSTAIRLTTDAPLSMIDSEAPFVVTRPLHHGVRSRRAVHRRLAENLPRFSRTHPRLLDGMGAPAVDLLRLARGDHPRRHYAKALQFR